MLVTGAAGFVGSHLVAQLLDEHPPREVVGWRRPGSRSDPRRRPGRGRPGTVTWREVDVLDRDAVRRAITEHAPQQVYHCAGAAGVAGSWNDRLATLRTNVLGTEHLLAALRPASPAARVLLPGSALVYRPRDHALDEDADIRPVSPYGLSKLAQEMLVTCDAGAGPEVVRTRSFTHIGPGQDRSYAASSFACQIAHIEAGRAEPTLRAGNLDARRDLLDVRDTVRAYRALMERGTSGAVYNVCSGTDHSMRDVLDGLLARARVPVEVRFDPARLRPSDYPVLRGDRTRITADVGWKPRIALRETLRDLLEDWRAALD